jgi:hypothetical protein
MKSDQNIGHFTWRNQYLLSLPAEKMRHESIFKKEYFDDFFYSNMYLINKHTEPIFIFLCGNS